MNANIEELRLDAENAKMLYLLGAISREEAKQRITPYAETYNSKSQELAKKYQQKASRFSIAAYLR